MGLRYQGTDNKPRATSLPKTGRKVGKGRQRKRIKRG